MVSCNGGLNRMRLGLLLKTWHASSFQDIFDVGHFITSLRDEVRMLEEFSLEENTVSSNFDICDI
ncbi:hypothetical protein Tsubulata_031929, partial [Turnera subulata]